jgi:quercetin dioxygenase-like cupin family protein
MSLYRWDEMEETIVFRKDMKFKRKVILGETMVVQRILNHEGGIDGRCSYPSHSHPEEQILINLQGRKYIRVGNERFTMEPGDVFLLPADVEHEVTSDVNNLFLEIKNRIPGHSWHGRDWAPGAEEDWKKMRAMLKEMERKYNQRK